MTIIEKIKAGIKEFKDKSQKNNNFVNIPISIQKFDPFFKKETCDVDKTVKGWCINTTFDNKVDFGDLLFFNHETLNFDIVEFNTLKVNTIFAISASNYNKNESGIALIRGFVIDSSIKFSVTENTTLYIDEQKKGKITKTETTKIKVGLVAPNENNYYFCPDWSIKEFEVK